MSFRFSKKALLLFTLGMSLSFSSCAQITELTSSPPQVHGATPEVSPIANLTIKLIYISPEVPSSLVGSIELPTDYALTDDPRLADLSLVTVPVSWDDGGDFNWMYVVVSPFPTTMDNISITEIESIWKGENTETPLLLTEKTKALFAELWGAPANVTTIDEEYLQSNVLDERPAFALIPFEDLNPQWKVISVDRLNPIRNDNDWDTYPLMIHFEFTGDPEILQDLHEDIASGRIGLGTTNYDTNKLTVVLLTGTTALVRSTAERMETKGLDYPGEQLRNWLTEPDITHVSNEASFTENCPDPNPDVISTQFCSKPEYIELFDYTGVDVVEQTGNHLLNYGAAGMDYSLELYAQHGMLTYGGGADSTQARQPLLLEMNGNKIAFLGCNNSGNELEWATEDSAGAAQCDFSWMADEIEELKQEGYVVIVTLQDLEGYSMMPMSWVRDNFIQMADAGADIVSGSQAHFPQGFEFTGNTFIHYGLGNLFFDQMDFPVTGTRREFLDRYIIYDGRLISIEILTAMLEDYAQPRPMTEGERQQFLQEYFTASGW